MFIYYSTQRREVREVDSEINIDTYSPLCDLCVFAVKFQYELAFRFFALCANYVVKMHAFLFRLNIKFG